LGRIILAGGPNVQSANEDFVRLFMPLQGDLLAYVLARGVPISDAEDVLQNAACVVLAKISDYEHGTNFRAWCYAILRNEVSNHLKKCRRRMLSLSTEAAADIAALAEAQSDGPSAPLTRLNHCLQKLQKKMRDLIRLRYESGMSVQEIAAEIGRPVESVYVTLSRLRKALTTCVGREPAAEGEAV
jgi:RNA polymerase sigma-70 factor (ECF subfamily)